MKAVASASKGAASAAPLVPRAEWTTETTTEVEAIQTSSTEIKAGCEVMVDTTTAI